jgi:hypothetical protein
MAAEPDPRGPRPGPIDPARATPHVTPDAPSVTPDTSPATPPATPPPDASPPGPAFARQPDARHDRSLPGERRAADRRAGNERGLGNDRAHGEPISQAQLAPVGDRPQPTSSEAPAARDVAIEAQPDRRPPPGEAPGFNAGPVCTAPQLRRFIKSRPYVPMHELRRRFGINGSEDDVTGIDLATGRVYVGLPGREGSLLGELLRGGEVGFELSLDPRTPIVIGLYPMRPVARS